MRLNWSGNYFDGITAKRHAVEAALTPTGITIVLQDGSQIFWPYEETTQTLGYYEGAPVRLERGTEPPEALVIADVEFLNALKKVAPGHRSRFHDPASRSLRILWIALGALGAVAFAAFIYLKAIPAAAAAAAAVVPHSWEDKLGESVTESFIKDFLVCDAPIARESVEKIVAKLDSAPAPHPYTFRVHILKHPMINAFALPGGHIVVFSGLIDETRNAEELAGVLAHEMVHVLRKHSLKNIFQTLSTRVLLSLIFGDVTAMGEAALMLGNMRYSRASETEADLMGRDLLIRAGIDPSGMVRFFEMLKEKTPNVSGQLEYLSSHPLTEDRIRALKTRGGGDAPTPEPLLAHIDWAEATSACSAAKGLRPPKDLKPPQR